MDENIVLKEKERSLYLGMVPKRIKELFIQLADNEFSSHYGFCLQWLIDQALEYQKVKEIILDTEFIHHILEGNPQTEMEETEPATESIRMLSGRKVKKEVKKDE